MQKTKIRPLEKGGAARDAVDDVIGSVLREAHAQAPLPEGIVISLSGPAEPLSVSVAWVRRKGEVVFRHECHPNTSQAEWKSLLRIWLGNFIAAVRADAGAS